jgi:hypothetical protein
MNPDKLPPQRYKCDPDDEKQKEDGLQESFCFLSLSLGGLRTCRKVFPRLTFGLIGDEVIPSAVEVENWLLNEAVGVNWIWRGRLEGRLAAPVVDGERLPDVVVGAMLALSDEEGVSSLSIPSGLVGSPLSA